jgi:hypothetical protein
MIDEQNVREMLHRRANAVPTPVVDPPKATRRARRRLFVNGAVAMLAVAAIALAGLAGLDDIRSAPVPRRADAVCRPVYHAAAHPIHGDLRLAAERSLDRVSVWLANAGGDGALGTRRSHLRRVRR